MITTISLVTVTIKISSSIFFNSLRRDVNSKMFGIPNFVIQTSLVKQSGPEILFWGEFFNLFAFVFYCLNLITGNQSVHIFYYFLI